MQELTIYAIFQINAVSFELVFQFFSMFTLKTKRFSVPVLIYQVFCLKYTVFLKMLDDNVFFFAVKKILGFPLTSQTISKIKDNAASSLVFWLFTLDQIFTLKIISAENDNFRKWKFWNTIQECFSFCRKSMFQSDIELFTF